MAIIRRERRGSVWPWIVGLVVAALAIWALLEIMDDGPEAAAYEAAALPVEAAPAGAATAPTLPAEDAGALDGVIVYPTEATIVPLDGPVVAAATGAHEAP